MTLEAGNSECTTGLSRRIYDARVAVGSVMGIPANPAGHAPLKADCYAIATAIVDEIQANAEAVVDTSSAGLQTTTALGSPTGPPAGEVTLVIR